MQSGNINVLPVNGSEYKDEIHTLYPRLFDGRTKAISQTNKHTILLMNCDQKIGAMIKSCLPQEGYEVLNAIDKNLTYDTIQSINPLLLMLGIKEVNNESMQHISSIKSNPLMNNVALVVISSRQPSVTAIDKLFSRGVTDYIFNSKNNEEGQLMRRIKAIIKQVSLLEEYRCREMTVQEEKERLASEFIQLHDRARSKQREALTHLELLIHTKELNETIVNKINDLTPYLNVHGKAKLKQLTRQIKWELNEEQDLNVERKFDEMNYSFYEALQSECSALTRYEMRLCAYLKSNNGSADIARITRKTSNCINVAFARIRSKLRIDNNKELKDHLNKIQQVKSKELAMA